MGFIEFDRVFLVWVVAIVLFTHAGLGWSWAFCGSGWGW